MKITLNEDFIDITSCEFADSSRSGLFVNFLMQSLIRIIKPMINDEMVDDALMVLNNSMIRCVLPGLKVYCNHTLNEIARAYVNDYLMSSKIVVKYQDKLFALNMRLHNGYIILANTDDTIELLDENLKPKKK